MIDLDNNWFFCFCRNFVFLMWFWLYKLCFINYENYICMEDFLNFDLFIDILKIDCKFYFLWYIIGSIFGMLFVSFIISFLIYKNWWKICYLCYIVNKKFYGYYRFLFIFGGEFEYDVYVLYFVKDVFFIKNEMVLNLEEWFGLKFVIMYRDMLLCGNYVINIMDYIC